VLRTFYGKVVKVAYGLLGDT